MILIRIKGNILKDDYHSKETTGSKANIIKPDTLTNYSSYSGIYSLHGLSIIAKQWVWRVYS